MNEKFVVDHTYTLSNFMVTPNDLVFKTTSHRSSVKFTRGTSVNDVDKNVTPFKTDNFTLFVDIITGRFKKDILIVTGYVYSFIQLYWLMLYGILLISTASFLKRHWNG